MNTVFDITDLLFWSYSSLGYGSQPSQRYLNSGHQMKTAVHSSISYRSYALIDANSTLKEFQLKLHNRNNDRKLGTYQITYKIYHLYSIQYEQ